MQKGKLHIIIGIAVLIVGSVMTASYYYGRYIIERADKVRLQENQAQYLAEKSDFVLLKQSLKEFKETMPSVIDSALKANKIKPKNVERVIERHYYYRDTTYKSHAPEPVITDKDTTYPFVDVSKCITITGFMQLHNKEPVLTITERQISNNSIDIVHLEREKKFLWWRVGRWKGKLQTINDCGETTTKEVEIVRGRDPKQ